jgi:hypothetical protein
VLNDEKIDWFNAGANYNDVIVAATNEAFEGSPSSPSTPARPTG